MTPRRAALAVALVLCGCAAVACSGSRTFARDDRLHIVSPAPLTSVSEPLTMRWVTTGRLSPAFAVFVDRNPVKPGHRVRDIADDQCKRQPQCPDAAYLATKGVYLTSSNSVTVTALPAVGGVGGTAPKPAHTATVVLLDRSNRRVGDVYWTVEFRG